MPLPSKGDFNTLVTFLRKAKVLELLRWNCLIAAAWETRSGETLDRNLFMGQAAK
jgi:hypothetical protein